MPNKAVHEDQTNATSWHFSSRGLVRPNLAPNPQNAAYKPSEHIRRQTQPKTTRTPKNANQAPTKNSHQKFCQSGVGVSYARASGCGAGGWANIADDSTQAARDQRLAISKKPSDSVPSLTRPAAGLSQNRTECCKMIHSRPICISQTNTNPALDNLSRSRSRAWQIFGCGAVRAA